MSRTMLKNYKMGLISYNDLLRATAQLFNATHEWDSITEHNIEEAVDYLGEDLVDYIVQHNKIQKCCIFMQFADFNCRTHH